jgi:hypothetical protein
VGILAQHLESAPNDWAANLIRRLDEAALSGGDREYMHSVADEVLLEALDSLGYESTRAIADAYREMKEKIGFWYS